MNKPDTLSVLVSEPQAFGQSPYLPYLWAILKSHAEVVAGLDGRVRWLDPIYQKGDPEAALEPYRDAPPDVFGLSCYTWNWDLQCALAARVKAERPQCLVVAGGPHPDYKDPEFFRKHPYVDAVAVKDGEVTFSRILARLLEGERDLHGIAGLYLPHPDGGPPVGTGPAEVPIAFEHSPYVAQNAYFQRLLERFGPGRFDVVWETNRGCPYSCNFCDWGSNTMSKVRRFDMGRVQAEIEWFASMQVKSIILADANFGILARDLEIADMLNETRARRGHPRFIHYSPAKNNPERTIEIARKFVKSGISPVHTFAVQHTDVGVLAAADRANISVDKQRQVAKAVVSADIPTLVQLIVGIPGDTYDLWKTCLTDLMDWGLHDNFQIFNYTLLPNAPAADRNFRREWEVKTISRQIPREGTGERDSADTDALTRVDVIVECKSYSREDWVRMKTYGAFVRALHNRSLARLPAMYLHFAHGVPYRDVYDRLIEGYFAATPIHARLLEHFRAFLEDEDSLEDVPFERLPGRQPCFEASRWAFIQICWDFDRYFDGMARYLMDAFPGAPALASALQYQRDMVILPGYDSRQGKSFRTEFDWVSYFESARLLTRHEPLGEPERTPDARVLVEDGRRDLQWAERDEAGRWEAWIAHTREMQRTLSINFQGPRLERAAPAAVGG